jgi:hypothetical protein
MTGNVRSARPVRRQLRKLGTSPRPATDLRTPEAGPVFTPGTSISPRTTGVPLCAESSTLDASLLYAYVQQPSCEQVRAGAQSARCLSPEQQAEQRHSGFK